MGKKNRNSDNKAIAKIALVTAILALVNALVNLLTKLIDWLGKP
jgi:hypothetical protein